MDEETGLGGYAVLLGLDLDDGPGHVIIDQFVCARVCDDDKEERGEEGGLDIFEVHDIMCLEKKIVTWGITNH